MGILMVERRWWAWTEGGKADRGNKGNMGLGNRGWGIWGRA